MNDRKSDCSCQDSLVITRKQASRLISGLIVCAFFLFVSGYFWGKKKALELYTLDLSRELFAADQQAKLDLGNDRYDDNQSMQEQPATAAPAPIQPKLSSEQEDIYYKAQLVGFGTLTPAQHCVERLKKNGITTTIVKRISTPHAASSRKKNLCWYQVVTERYTDKHQLELLVEKIKKSEKIHDVQIVKV